MCGCGYTYRKLICVPDTGSGHTELLTLTYPFVVVNDTWSDTHQYSYYPEQEIGGDGIANVVTDSSWVLTTVQ